MTSTNPEQWLCLKRAVRFGETDAAGVIHFHQLLRWCHEAWEESLEHYGLEVSEVFPRCIDQDTCPDVALPIVHCEADFFLPITTGDQLLIELMPEKINLSSFQVQTKFKRGDEHVARGLIRHLAINSETRTRCSLPECIDRWIEASSLNLGLRPI